MESKDALFFEDVFLHKRNEGNNIPKRTREELSKSHEDETHRDTEKVKSRRSIRERTSKTFDLKFLTYMLEHEPQTYKEAMSSSEFSCWKEAIQSEIDSILSNETWKIVDLPPGIKPIGCKWIFKKKMKPDGSIDKYKARFVAK